MNRKALIIGNKNYSDKPLETPINDSKDVASLLSRKNFRISLKNDLDIESMNKVIIDFVDSIKEGIFTLLDMVYKLMAIITYCQ